jgi:hypothetical protein
MLSPKIDLTEHMDFSGGSINLMDTLIEIPNDEYSLMSSDEYEWFIWWEGIFGRKGHRNQKHEIFNPDTDPFIRSKSHCYRCGKPFRIPWDNIGGVCRKCDSEMCDSVQAIPWKKYSSPRERDVAYNLFNRR